MMMESGDRWKRVDESYFSAGDGVRGGGDCGSDVSGWAVNLGLAGNREGDDKRRFPAGMTERKARAEANSRFPAGMTKRKRGPDAPGS
jgi:hypothetical protein